MAIKPGWIPPRSPYSLIQEDIFPDEWCILVACMMLNCTSRKQVEKVITKFIERWPDPGSFMRADPDEVVSLCRPLGFANRRTQNMFKMTERYLAGPWAHASELPGIGEYGAAAWEIFCLGTISDKPPKDHALVQYHMWIRNRLNK